MKPHARLDPTMGVTAGARLEQNAANSACPVARSTTRTWAKGGYLSRQGLYQGNCHISMATRPIRTATTAWCQALSRTIRVFLEPLIDRAQFIAAGAVAAQDLNGKKAFPLEALQVRFVQFEHGGGQWNGNDPPPAVIKILADMPGQDASLTIVHDAALILSLRCRS